MQYRRNTVSVTNIWGRDLENQKLQEIQNTFKTRNDFDFNLI